MKEIFKYIINKRKEKGRPARLISLPPHIPYGIPDGTLSQLTNKPTSETICIEPMFEIQEISIDKLHIIQGTTQTCSCIECSAEFEITFPDNKDLDRDLIISPIYKKYSQQPTK